MIDQTHVRMITQDVYYELAKSNCTPLLVAVYGSHHYGFPSEDSDYDIRVIHVADTKDLFRFVKPKSPLMWQGTNTDYKSYEVEQALDLLFKNNPTMLEIMTARNLIEDSSEMHKIREAGFDAISKRAAPPYLGRAEHDHKKYISDNNPIYYDKHVKKYLYIFNSLLIGERLLNTGIIEPDINKHIETLPQHLATPINWLIHKKQQRDYEIPQGDYARLNDVYHKLLQRFTVAEHKSVLKEEPHNFTAFDDLLKEIRMAYL
jgi:predicted nucleotidyltransferase